MLLLLLYQSLEMVMSSASSIAHERFWKVTREHHLKEIYLSLLIGCQTAKREYETLGLCEGSAITQAQHTYSSFRNQVVTKALLDLNGRFADLSVKMQVTKPRGYAYPLIVIGSEDSDKALLTINSTKSYLALPRPAVHRRKYAQHNPIERQLSYLPVDEALPENVVSLFDHKHIFGIIAFGSNVSSHLDFAYIKFPDRDYAHALGRGINLHGYQSMKGLSSDSEDSTIDLRRPIEKIQEEDNLRIRRKPEADPEADDGMNTDDGGDSIG